MGFWSKLFGNKKYSCQIHPETGRVQHDPACREGRPLCKHRRPPCRCAAAHWPHRPGSLRGCREGGIPEILLQSRSYQEQQAAHASRSKGRWGTRVRNRSATRARKRW